MINLPNGWRVRCFLELIENERYRVTMTKGKVDKYIFGTSFADVKIKMLDYIKKFDRVRSLSKEVLIRSIAQGQVIYYDRRSQAGDLVQRARVFGIKLTTTKVVRDGQILFKVKVKE